MRLNFLVNQCFTAMLCLKTTVIAKDDWVWCAHLVHKRSDSKNKISCTADIFKSDQIQGKSSPLHCVCKSSYRVIREMGTSYVKLLKPWHIYISEHTGKTYNWSCNSQHSIYMQDLTRNNKMWNFKFEVVSHDMARACRDLNRKNTMLRKTMSGLLGKTIQTNSADPNSEVTQESRIRLVTGLKRSFHSKRAGGLLSGKGMQILDYACDVQMDNPEEPLFMWQLIERWVLQISYNLSTFLPTLTQNPFMLSK